MKKLFDLIIFGATGDLSLRKLLPAMYRAFCQGSIDEASIIYLCCRKSKDFKSMEDTVKVALKEFLEPDEFAIKQWEKFSTILQPVLVDLIDLEKGWSEFSKQLEGKEERVRLFYLAVMPSIYAACCENLSASNLISPASRIVVEKPLGYDFDSAEEINQVMAKYFNEEQIYRIDHYLGKETVQNLLALRFGNFLFETIWDSKSIEHIQISICEQVGLEGRAGFYDGAGAMRDMVQNHLLQLLCLVAMESPNKLDAEDVRFEKIKILKALQPLTGKNIAKNIVRGQYVSGQVKGNKVTGYLDELGNYQSNTETFVAIKAHIESWRWAGVPFYLRTGKRLKERSAEIVIQFKDVTHNVYGVENQQLKPNKLLIQLQPKEKIQLVLMAKDIGNSASGLKPITLNLDFKKEPGQPFSSDYQRLLLDAISGNSTLFIHRDEVKAAWKWVDPIIESWNQNKVSPELYSAGSWGPAKANELFEEDGQCWINLSDEQGSI